MHFLIQRKIQRLQGFFAGNWSYEDTKLPWLVHGQVGEGDKTYFSLLLLAYLVMMRYRITNIFYSFANSTGKERISKYPSGCPARGPSDWSAFFPLLIVVPDWYRFPWFSNLRQNGNSRFVFTEDGDFNLDFKLVRVGFLCWSSSFRDYYLPLRKGEAHSAWRGRALQKQTRKSYRS